MYKIKTCHKNILYKIIILEKGPFQQFVQMGKTPKAVGRAILDSEIHT